MKPTAIVFSSNTGFTERYAKMFAEKTGLPFYSFADAKQKPAKGTSVIYFGWIMAGTVVDYKKAAKIYDIAAVCGVSLAPTGVLEDNVRRNCRIPENIPVFTVQGGMDHGKLRGGYGFGIKMLIKIMSVKKNRTEEDDAMLELLIKGGDYVSEENLANILGWYENL